MGIPIPHSETVLYRIILNGVRLDTNKISLQIPFAINLTQKIIKYPLDRSPLAQHFDKLSEHFCDILYKLPFKRNVSQTINLSSSVHFLNKISVMRRKPYKT